MGFFDKILGKEQEGDAPDLEEYLDEREGDIINPPADFYVKRVDLRNEGDAALALKELAEKNIIILNVKPIVNQPKRLKTLIGKLKANADKINGDIALLTTELIILTPSKVLIVKSKKQKKKL
ncbi:cell division protein SepF [Candidatus Micrarchaeota archaeon]|nr:cell division protein SepF [Candidatus Micrarchaeota archaeon]